MNWINENTVEIIKDFNKLSEATKKMMLKDICEFCISRNTFDWNKYYTLVKLLPYVSSLTPKMRTKFVQTFGGQVLLRLEYYLNYENFEGLIDFQLEDTDVSFLFELRGIIAFFDKESVEAKFLIKNLDILIKQILQNYDKSKTGYLDLFFRNLEYPYTKQSLKKCKAKIIKENHPDNGGSGEYIQTIQSVYKIFLNYLDGVS